MCVIREVPRSGMTERNSLKNSISQDVSKRGFTYPLAKSRDRVPKPRGSWKMIHSSSGRKQKYYPLVCVLKLRQQSWLTICEPVDTASLVRLWHRNWKVPRWCSVKILHKVEWPAQTCKKMAKGLKKSNTIHVGFCPKCTGSCDIS